MRRKKGNGGFTKIFSKEIGIPKMNLNIFLKFFFKIEINLEIERYTIYVSDKYLRNDTMTA
jgi:hypothetical protein